MTFKRLSKRTLSVILCALILLSTTLVGSISASATSWTRGTSSYIYFDASNLFTGIKNSNWFTADRYRLFVVTSSRVYSFKLSLAGVDSSSLENQKDKTKLLYLATSTLSSYHPTTASDSSERINVLEQGVDFFSFVYITSKDNGTSGDLHNNTDFDRTLVYNNDGSVKSNPSYLTDYTSNYSEGISSEKGARMIFSTPSGTHPSVSMEHVGNDLNSLNRTQTIVTTSGGSVNYNGYAINKVKNSTNVFGNISANSSADVNVTHSSELKLTAVPDTGASFDGWYDDSNQKLSNDAAYTYTVKGEKTVYAKFVGGVETEYEQNAVAGEGGSVSAELEGVNQILPFDSSNGKSVTLTASPSPGYLFEGWYDNSEYKGNAVSKNTTYTYKVKGEKTFYARFIRAYSQSVTVYTNDSANGVGGSVTAKSGEESLTLPYTALSDEEITLTAEANDGYEFDGWYNGSSLLSSSEEYTYTVSGDNSIKAKFSTEEVYVKPESSTFSFNSSSLLYLDISKNNWTASRVRIILFDGINAHARVLSNVTYAKLAAKTASSIISKSGTSWADVTKISFVYFDNSSKSNSFKDGMYSDLLDSSGNVTQSAIAKYGITGYTESYSTAIADEGNGVNYHIFKPATVENNASLTVNSSTTFPKTASHTVRPRYSTATGTLSYANTGGTVKVKTAYKKASLNSLSSSFEELADADISGGRETSGTTTTLSFESAYATKVVLTATISNESDYSFIGWFDKDDKQLEFTNKSNHLEYTFYPTEATTVRARFAPIYEYVKTSESPKTAKLTKFNYNDTLSEITIPSTANLGSNYTVTEIASGAFKDNPGLKVVEIPSSVTKICDKAFEGCTGLDEVTVNSDTTVFEGEPFLNTRVADDPIILFGQTINSTARTHADNYYYLYFMPLNAVSPEDEYKYIYKVVDLGNDEIELVQYLGDRSAERITIPDTIVIDSVAKTVTKIGAKLYFQCKKAYYIHIPEHVNEIGTDALPKYTTYYDVALGNNTYKSVVDTNYNYADDIPDARSDLYSKDGLTFIRYAAGNGTRHLNESEARKKYTVQDGVTTIAEGAFKNSSTHINSITLPSSVTTIDDEAFSYCLNLRTINIPSAVTSIGDKAFMNCRSLESITTYGSLGDEIFSGCIKLNEININGASSIGDYAFSGCHKLKYITDETDSITTVGANVIRECENLSEITSTKIVASIESNNLIEESKRFITSNNKTCIVYEGAMRTDTADNNSFGISDRSYTNIGTLGVQKKDTNAIRFVTAINSKLLKDSKIEDYGYVMGKLEISSPAPETVASIRERMDRVNNSNATELSLKGSDNKLSGNYGLYSEDTNYKYVTAAVEDITNPYNILFARFYIKTTGGDIIYSTYQTSVIETKQIEQYQTDEYGNQIYDENGNPVTEYLEETEIVRKKFNGCVLQPSNLS